MDLFRMRARDLAREVRAGRLKAEAVADACLSRIGQWDGPVHAFLHVMGEQARKDAREVDRKVAAGADPGPLAGVPVAIKDNMCTAGAPTTCSSRILEGFKPPFDATVVRRLREAGALLVGKTNLDEFAMGSSTENSAFGPTRNPWDVTRTPGGSSGGSAAAVAARMTPLSLGSDTGGSIRQPASLCGISGLKPTYGRVSRYGLIAFGSSLDQIGPLATDTQDMALALQVISGHDPLDSTSAPVPVPDYSAAATQSDIRGLRLGVPREYFGAGIDPEVEARVRTAIDVLRTAGAIVQEVSLPHTDYGIASYYVVAPAEASSNLARYDGVRYGYRFPDYEGLVDLYSRSRDHGFGAEVKRRIMLGTFVLSSGYYDAYYNRALKVRSLIRRDFDRAFETVDAIVCPTSPVPAFPIGERAADPLQMYLCDVFTVCVNMAGIPGLSIPCGFAGPRLPVGLQILGKAFDETTLLRVAAAYESRTGFHQEIPSAPGSAGG